MWLPWLGLREAGLETGELGPPLATVAKLQLLPAPQLGQSALSLSPGSRGKRRGKECPSPPALNRDPPSTSWWWQGAGGGRSRGKSPPLGPRSLAYLPLPHPVALGEKQGEESPSWAGQPPRIPLPTSWWQGEDEEEEPCQQSPSPPMVALVGGVEREEGEEFPL